MAETNPKTPYTTTMTELTADAVVTDEGAYVFEHSPFVDRIVADMQRSQGRSAE